MRECVCSRLQANEKAGLSQASKLTHFRSDMKVRKALSDGPSRSAPRCTTSRAHVCSVPAEQHAMRSAAGALSACPPPPERNNENADVRGTL